MKRRQRYAESKMVDGFNRKQSGAGLVFMVSLATLTSSAVQIEPSAAAAMCADLTGFSLPQTKVTLARPYRADEMVSGATKAPVGLCRVAGTSKPSSDSNINFEVWIPTNGRWNGKYEQIGNGGFAGTIWVPLCVPKTLNPTIVVMKSAQDGA
jgi:hypothetical protein